MEKQFRGELIQPLMTYNELSHAIIGAAIEVHREMGPGLLERVYERCLATELRAQGYEVLEQHALPVHYKGQDIGLEYRLDLWVDRRIIVEVKAVDQLHDVHRAQLLNYLKLTRNKLGLLINFNVPLLKQGVERLLNGHIGE